MSTGNIFILVGKVLLVVSGILSSIPLTSVMLI
jgi:hypothetical protein